jgi:hypothetical protein
MLLNLKKIGQQKNCCPPCFRYNYLSPSHHIILTLSSANKCLWASLKRLALNKTTALHAGSNSNPFFYTFSHIPKLNVMRTAEVQYGDNGHVDVSVPKGTKMEDIAKLQALVLKQINPRGCQTCISGVHFNIREELEQVVTVDLDKMAVVQNVAAQH